MAESQRHNEPLSDDVNRDVRETSRHKPPPPMTDDERRKRKAEKAASDHPHTETKREVSERMGETSDEYGGRHERDERVDMTEGEDLAKTNPDVVAEAPGDGRTDAGFADDRDDRRRT